LPWFIFYIYYQFQDPGYYYQLSISLQDTFKICPLVVQRFIPSLKHWWGKALCVNYQGILSCTATRKCLP